MAGRKSAWLIPPLERLRRNWIAHAETSASSSGWALSVYQFDRFEFDEFARRFELPERMVILDREMRSKFELDPRHWTKGGYEERGFTGEWSQYFVVDPRYRYPIATLRLGLKKLGLQDVSRIEPAFVSALERPDTLWALVAKWDGEEVRPRISCRIAPDHTRLLLQSLAENGFLTSEEAVALREIAERFPTSPYHFVSVDPAVPGAVAIDVEWPDASQIPDLHIDGGRLEPRGIRYLKFRLGRDGQPKWTYYRPLAEILPDPVFDHLVRRPARLLDRAREYYDRNNASILATVGPIYQAGLIGQRGTPETTMRNLIAAAGVQQGERVADLGCGAGGPAVLMARLVDGVRVDGLTISSEQARAGASLAKAHGVEDRVKILVGDFHAAPLESGTYDRVVFFESIGYSDDVNQVLREAFRLLRPGGMLYVKDVVRKPDPLGRAEALELAEFDEVYCQRTPTPQQIAAAMALAGFTDLKGEPLNGLASTLGFAQAMRDRSSPDGLSDFGRRHHRSFQALPVTFMHFTAVRPRGTE